MGEVNDVRGSTAVCVCGDPSYRHFDTRDADGILDINGGACTSCSCQVFRPARNGVLRMAEDYQTLVAERDRLKAEVAILGKQGAAQTEEYAAILSEENERLRAALKAIVGPSVAGPGIQTDHHLETYRAAGGGYEGLQAIAQAALAGYSDEAPRG